MKTLKFLKILGREFGEDELEGFWGFE